MARLRILRPIAGHVTIVAESGDESIPANTNGPFATNLPAQAGDLIGFKTGNPAGNIAPYYPGQTGDTAQYILGAASLGDSACGSMFACATANSSLTNVSVTLHAPDSSPPPNTFSFGKVKRNKKKGTATLPVNVPGAGILSLTSKGAKHQRSAGATASQVASGAGTVNLAIKPKTKIKKKLNRRGEAKVKVTVAYTPTGGSLAKQSERVKLVKRP